MGRGDAEEKRGGEGRGGVREEGGAQWIEPCSDLFPQCPGLLVLYFL